MPLLPPERRYSACSSKSLGAPPRQIKKVFCLGLAPGFVSPAMAPFSTRQYAGSPSQPFRVWSSKIELGFSAGAAAGSHSTTQISSAPLRLRNAQSKGIQGAVLGPDIHTAPSHRGRAEVREAVNRVPT